MQMQDFFSLLLWIWCCRASWYPQSLHKHVHAVGGEDRAQIVEKERERTKVEAGESKIRGKLNKFLLQKRRRRKQFLQHVLIWNLNLHHCVSTLQLRFGNPPPPPPQLRVWAAPTRSESAAISPWQEHHQLVKTCLLTFPTRDSSPALMRAERLVTCIQLQPAHLNTLDLFSVWSKQKKTGKKSKLFSFFFVCFFLSQKPPLRGWLHDIHHHASLMTSGQEHGVKSQSWPGAKTS